MFVGIGKLELQSMREAFVGEAEKCPLVPTHGDEQPEILGLNVGDLELKGNVDKV